MLISKFPNNNVEERIAELENKFNISLPTQYRKFLCKYNGGDTPETKYKAGRKSSDLRAFYGFGEVGYSIDKFTDLPEWIDNGIFPIACDFFGNYIAIGVNEDTYGKIYFADHEAGFGKSLIADNFKEFTMKCKSKKESLVQEKTPEESIFLAIENVTDKDSFIQFLDLLSRDYVTNQSEWVNKSVIDFIKAMSSWTEDYSSSPANDIDWNEVDYKTMAKILYMGKLYE